MSNIKSFSITVDVPAQTKRDYKAGTVVTTAPATRKTVLLEIDLDNLQRNLCLRAALNRTGRAVLGGGAITAKLYR